MNLDLDVAIIGAMLWGFFCGLYGGNYILKHISRSYKASLRRARRVYIDVDAQCINGKQLVCRVTINHRKALLLFVSSESPLDYQVKAEDDNVVVPVDEQTFTVQ